MNGDPPTYSAARLIAVLVVLSAFILLIVIYILPPLATNVRASVRADELNTARALAATIRAPTPSTTPLPITLLPTELIPIASGGIGLERSRWEATYGVPDPRSGHFIVYGTGTYIVEFQDERVAYIERIWDENQPVSLADARLVATLLLPFDNELLESSEQSSEPVSEIYTSGFLRDILRANRPQDNMTGNIRVAYIQHDGAVSAVTLTVEGYTPQRPSK